MRVLLGWEVMKLNSSRIFEEQGEWYPRWRRLFVNLCLIYCIVWRVMSEASNKYADIVVYCEFELDLYYRLYLLIEARTSTENYNEYSIFRMPLHLVSD
jgi:hypothetical protein